MWAVKIVNTKNLVYFKLYFKRLNGNILNFKFFFIKIEFLNKNKIFKHKVGKNKNKLLYR